MTSWHILAKYDTNIESYGIVSIDLMFKNILGLACLPQKGCRHQTQKAYVSFSLVFFSSFLSIGQKNDGLFLKGKGDLGFLKKTQRTNAQERGG